MTPALTASFRLADPPAAPLPGEPPLPLLWRGRWLLTREHAADILDSLAAGVPIAATLRAVLGATTAAGMFGRRKHSDDDAASALRAACEACPALRRAVDVAEAEGLRVVAVGGASQVHVRALAPAGSHGGESGVSACEDGSAGSKTKHEGSEQVHAPQRATAEATPQALTVRELAARLAREAAEGPREEAAPARSKRASEATDDDGVSDRWARAHEEATALGGAESNIGRLLWVERHCVDAGLHPMHPLWIRHFADFYASGAFEDVGRFGVRAAKSDSTCRAIAAEVLLMPRVLERTVNARCPVMSANVGEANERFVTLTEILRACGILDFIGHGEPNEGSFKKSGGGMAPLVIELHDAQGHKVKFQVSAANEAAAAGFTGIAGFGDELDLWGKAQGANPAARVLRVLRSRYATQPGAKLHLMSATYDRESEHARLIKEGATIGRYIARIGEDGARADHEARLRLAALIHSADPLLLAPPLPPDCPDIPSWVTNPIAPIEAAHSKSADLREMFGLYGGRLDLAGGGTATSLADLRWMAEQNRALNEAPRTNAQRADDCMRGDDDGDPRAYRGL